MLWRQFGVHDIELGFERNGLPHRADFSNAKQATHLLRRFPVNKGIALPMSLLTSSVSMVVLLVPFLFMVGPVQAADLGKAKGTVDNIRQADPPQVSTSTKKNPSGIPTSEFKPPAPSLKTKEPPSPVNRNNPQNDPAVQKGFNKHQKEHGK